MGYSSSLGSFLNNRLTDFTQQEIAAQLEFHGPSGNATVIHDESSKVELSELFFNIMEVSSNGRKVV